MIKISEYKRYNSLLDSNHLSINRSPLVILSRHTLLITWRLIYPNWLSKRREWWLLSINRLSCRSLWHIWSLHEWLFHLWIISRWRWSHWRGLHYWRRIKSTSIVIIIWLEIRVFYRLHLC